MLLGRSQGLCGRSWAVLGSLLVVLGRLGSALGCYVGGLALLLRPAWAVLAALGAFVGGLVPLLGPMLAVLWCSWGLRWRSWTALGTYVGDPGPSWAEKCEEHGYLENVLISRAGMRSAASGAVLGRS